MFFTELAVWISINLLRYDIHSLTIVNIIDQRLAYCRTVYNEVLIYREDRDKINARDQLTEVIKNLKSIRDTIEQAIVAQSFKTRIDAIQDQCTGMMMETFELFYYLIEGKITSKREFYLPAILKVDFQNKQAYELLNTITGRWIQDTFYAAEISDASFKHIKQCGLIVMKSEVTIENFRNLSLSISHTYILHDNKLYYVNLIADSVDLIFLSSEQINEFVQTYSPTSQIQILTTVQLTAIKKLTKHVLPKSIYEEHALIGSHLSRYKLEELHFIFYPKLKWPVLNPKKM
jgi:hypothetical protein